MYPTSSNGKLGKLDLVGVGIGPFNLSLAALLAPLDEIRCRFFDNAPQFNWHPGMLFEEATLQVSFIKDLVTLADPTSQYSFLSFLFARRRLYQFINAGFPRVSRAEFNQYLRWVCDSLPSLEFGKKVDAIKLNGDSFLVEGGSHSVTSRNIVIGTGLSPYIPECARPHIGSTVWHGCSYLRQSFDPAGQRVVVLGGGQTGAEIVFHLLSDQRVLPEKLIWISRRSNFVPLDESAFTNELFTPAYSDYFFGLSEPTRRRLLDEQKLASNGISTELLIMIYRRLYELKYLNGHADVCRLLPCKELMRLHRGNDEWVMSSQDILSGKIEYIHADLVILCTGFEYNLPSCLEPLAARLCWEGDGLAVRDDFSIEWDGPENSRIYVQNAARHKRGIADPNLSLMAWRSAIIANSVAGHCVYDIRENDSLFEWMGDRSVADNERIFQ